MAATGCAEPARRYNLLVVSIDTLRADRVSCYGYGRETTPALDRWAAERAVRFTHAIAESSWTLPSHVSLLTGLHPLRHGVRQPDHAPSVDLQLLGERLADRGYATFARTGGGWLSEGWGFDRGFDAFVSDDRPFAETVCATIEDLGRLEEADEPWFAFLHTYDVHCPYDPPEPWFSMFADPASEPIDVAGRCGNPDFNETDLTPGQLAYLSDRYDGGVRAVDDALAELFRHLDEEEAWEDTVVVVTSDHGEEFGEHGQVGHERTLSLQALKIPFLVAAPGVSPGVVDTPVGLVDVVPTVVELLGLAGTEEADGRSLVPLLSGKGAGDFATHRLSELAWQERLSSWTSPAEHVVFDHGSGDVEYYDLLRDPDESEDRIDENRLRIETLRDAHLDAYEALSSEAYAPARATVELPAGLRAPGE